MPCGVHGRKQVLHDVERIETERHREERTFQEEFGPIRDGQ